jgi:hypothetical protein
VHRFPPSRNLLLQHQQDLLQNHRQVQWPQL